MKNRYILIVLLVLLFQSVESFGQASQPAKRVPKQLSPALLVIDIQNEYLPIMAEDDKKLAMRMINGSIWLFRQNGFPVIRVYNQSPEWGPKPGDQGFEFPSSVIINENDPKVIKSHPSAFKKTDLEKILREKGCNTVILCGLSAVGCVLATYFDALNLDFNTFLVKDALLSHNSRLTDFVEEAFDAISFTTLKVLLESAEAPKK